MNISILSKRSLISSVSFDPLFELEDLLAKSCDGQILIPTARGITKWAYETRKPGSKLLNKIINRTVGPYHKLEDALPASTKPNVLLIIGITGDELRMLSSIPGWRKKFDIVAAYIFDAWGFETYPKYTSQLDHLFTPMPEIVESLNKHLGIPVSLLPFGADVLIHGSAQLDRPFDMISYGRIPGQYNSAFARKFNQPGSDRVYYRSTPRRSEEFPTNPYEKRRDQEDTLQLFHILRKTKLALAFDTLYPGMRQFPYSFVTLRWFDCTATGCVVVGKRPTTPLADELLCWEDATIELPDDPEASVKFIEELLEDTPRLHSIHKRNYVESLARHDWRLRLKNMFDKLNIPLPTPLVQELAQLKTLHTQMSQNLDEAITV